MLMDDTVILATSRAMFKKKLKILEKYCEEYGMVINADKTKFMVIHGDDSDKIHIWSWTQIYLYIQYTNYPMLLYQITYEQNFQGSGYLLIVSKLKLVDGLGYLLRKDYVCVGKCRMKNMFF